MRGRQQQANRLTANRPLPAARRGGAALIVVLSLLGALAFLGFLFYGFAAQERASAENFAEAATPQQPNPPDVYWDWALEQLILGPPTDAGKQRCTAASGRFCPT